MREVAAAARRLTPQAHGRITRAEALRRSHREDFDARAAERRFADLMAGGTNARSEIA